MAGAIDEVLGQNHSVALVSHRSVSKMDARQQTLVREIKALTRAHVYHVPVWVNKDRAQSHDYTQRSRSFLFASLAAVVARLFGLDGIRFYENGIVSINLPISAQVIGSRATRTTHPKVLNGFARLFGHVFGRKFTVENPFIWKTKSEVLDLLALRGAKQLTRDTVSCTHTMHTTKLKTHCGCCSQCIDRRFAVLSSGIGDEDPEEMYEVELWQGSRESVVDRTMAESYVRTALEINNLPDDSQFFARFPTVNSLTREFPYSSEETAKRIVELHKRHAGAVCALAEAALKDHALAVLRGALPPSSLIRILAGGVKQQTNWKQFVLRVGGELERGLVTAFKSKSPDKEAQVQDAAEAILNSFNEKFVREFPMFKWGIVGTKPDFSTEDDSIFIELKLLKDRKHTAGFVDQLVADREKYLAKAKHILFVVYQLGRLIDDEDAFCSSIERGEDAAVRLVIGRAAKAEVSR